VTNKYRIIISKNDKCLNSILKKITKLEYDSRDLLYLYEKDQHVKPVPIIYPIIESITRSYNALIVGIKEKYDNKEAIVSEKTDD